MSAYKRTSEDVAISEYAQDTCNAILQHTNVACNGTEKIAQSNMSNTDRAVTRMDEDVTILRCTQVAGNYSKILMAVPNERQLQQALNYEIDDSTVRSATPPYNIPQSIVTKLSSVESIDNVRIFHGFLVAEEEGIIAPGVVDCSFSCNRFPRQ